MTRLTWIAFAAVLACLSLSPVAARQVLPRIGLVAHDGAPVLGAPHSGAHILARLVEQTQVRVVHRGTTWDAVTIYSGVRAWMNAKDIVFRRPWHTVSTYHAPVVTTPIHAHAPSTLAAAASVLATTSTGQKNVLRPGQTVHVSGWRQDAAGHISYRIGGKWAEGSGIQFAPAHDGARGRTLANGKGMWLTVGTMADTDPSVLTAAAHHAGITHLYLEAAISPLGFHGRDVVGPVIEAAHRAGIRVFAWVYPYLTDVGSDIDLTCEVAAFRTAHGERFDGIAADLERNLDVWRIRAYSQIVRASLPHETLVAVTYPPQSLPTFPFAEVGRQYDAIAPMDYWHDTQTRRGPLFGGLPYGRAYAYRYGYDSVATIKSDGARVPIVPIGQTFDNFGRLEMGPYAPSKAEITGFLQGCRAAGAPGASFFQWMTASQPEWTAISDFHL